MTWQKSHQYSQLIPSLAKQGSTAKKCAAVPMCLFLRSTWKLKTLTLRKWMTRDEGLFPSVWKKNSSRWKFVFNRMLGKVTLLTTRWDCSHTFGSLSLFLVPSHTHTRTQAHTLSPSSLLSIRPRIRSGCISLSTGAISLSTVSFFSLSFCSHWQNISIYVFQSSI